MQLINQKDLFNNIKSKWEEELKRIKKFEDLGKPLKKREYLKGSLVDEGFAEKEDDHILFIYGNVYEVVLNNTKFQKSIKRVCFGFF